MVTVSVKPIAQVTAPVDKPNKDNKCTQKPGKRREVQVHCNSFEPLLMESESNSGLWAGGFHTDMTGTRRARVALICSKLLVSNQPAGAYLYSDGGQVEF